MEPLRPNVHIKMHYVSCFKRYYEDLGYLSKMTSKHYHQSHLASVDISHMLHYRSWLMEEEQPLNGLDHFAVKMIGKFVRNALPEGRAAVKKCLGHLGQQISHYSKSTLSMAHERVFALITMALCEGDLTRLRDHQFRDMFLRAAWDIHHPEDQGETVAAFLGDLVKQALRHMAFIRRHEQG